MQTENESFELLVRQVRRHAGLDCSYYKDNYLRRRIRSRMDSRRITSYYDYCLYLARNPGEYRLLLDVIGVNVTEFFRDIPVYRMLADTVIPGIIRRKEESGTRCISLWSAPCATGEEPYSLGIIMSELLGTRIRDYAVTIRATDIDQAALDTAREGLYPAARLENIGGELRARYFAADGPGGCRISPAVRRMVTFMRHDLISDGPFQSNDLIMSRNLLIYIKSELQPLLFEKFHEALLPGGYLVLGNTETLPSSCRERFETVSGSERVYRKR